jgi:diguanylate cyclase (GGDEF)-like protein/PAS domain S-box-containing protein
MRKVKQSIIFARLLLITTVLAIVCYVEYVQFKTEQVHEKFEINQSLTFLRGDIEATIYRNVELVKGLAAYISINPDITQDEFSIYVNNLLRSESNIRNLAAAKDLIITHLYPLEGNSKAFGIDYRDLPNQLYSVQKSIETNKIVLAGPIELVQGGQAIIGRLPVFIKGKNWGLVSIVMDYDSILQSFQLDSYSNINIAIRGKDSKGDEGDIFYGDEDLFDSPKLTQIIKLPYGSWVITAQPKQGWTAMRLHWATWTVAFIIIFALLYTMNLRFKNLDLEKEKQQVLAFSEAKFRNFFNLHTVVMLIIDEFGNIKDSNAAAQTFYGYPKHKLNGLAMSVLEVNEAHKQNSDVPSADSKYKEIVTRQHKLANGEIRDVKIYSTPVELDNQSQHFTIVFDITEQRKHELQLRLFEQVYKHAKEGIFVTDENLSIISTNPAFEKITGYSEQEVLGKKPSILNSDVHDERFYNDIYATLAKDGNWRGEIWNKNKDGNTYPRLSSISEVRNNENEISHYIAVFADITQQKQTEEKLEKLAHYDLLTGLPNRLTLKLHLEKAVEIAKRNKTQCALLFLDLDRFKVINDSLGHEAGDELLMKVGLRLKERLRAEDILARLGGDEFVILITDYSSDEQLAIIAEDLCQQIHIPFAIANDIEANLGASIGIAQYPKDTVVAEDLLKYADASMYKAKISNDVRYIFYNQDISTEASNRLTITTEIKRAVSENEFELFLQPQFDLSTHTLLGAEALIRWHHPKKGFLTPDSFIPLAESTKAIKLITEWVVKNVFEIATIWKQDKRNLILSFNVSAIELADQELFDRIIEKTIQYPDVSKYLSIEIVESALVENLDYAKAILTNLRKAGLNIAIDDFGTGFSSLSYLGELPVDILKIDRVFVQNMESELQHGIIKSIIDLANNFDLSVTAEGIETISQLNSLLSMGCTVGQGYYYSKPLSLSDFQKKYL